MISKKAIISKSSKIGKGTIIWHNTQVRENVEIGEYCIIGKDCYIDKSVKIGNKVKIQNSSNIYSGTIIQDEVFIGPNVNITNDKFPRATNIDGSLKKDGDWTLENVLIEKGSSIGASSTITPGITIHKFAMVGSGSVVTKDIPKYGLVVGNPARLVGYICRCGKKLSHTINKKIYKCKYCGLLINLDK